MWKTNTGTKGEGGDGMTWEIEGDIYTLLTLCIRQITIGLPWWPRQ